MTALHALGSVGSSLRLSRVQTSHRLPPLVSFPRSPPTQRRVKPLAGVELQPLPDHQCRRESAFSSTAKHKSLSIVFDNSHDRTHRRAQSITASKYKYA